MLQEKFGDQSKLSIGGTHDAPPIQTKTMDLSHMSEDDMVQLRALGRKVMQGGK